MMVSTRGTIVWLGGWSMPVTIFDRLRELLPEYQHVSVDFNDIDSPEKMLLLTETTAHRWKAAVGATDGDRGSLLVGGWSLGGLLALRLAVEGDVDGLLLFAATARFTRSYEERGKGWPDAYLKQMMKQLLRDPQSVESSFRQMLFTEAEQKAGLDRNFPPIGSWTTPALIAGLQILRSEEVLSRMSEITCPVLLVHGLEDKICPYNAAAELAAQWPQVELLSLPGCGHAPFWGREVMISEELRRWWDEHKNIGY
ncbi:pimeloyl-[acyl-carrier protein] methyl ester esterase [Paenibacillus marchantiophytorum]|uniref:Pimeloyl-[acyl-carrier protein] methyl ester esterase n=1 Tax=Paenibacillus marchantiophytorum TaxID=1619310 RepID=A0ABQ1EPV5_9BACL|nr:alpha/beta fold hydrolase [Paenibacillus marchantiophytorum]GFZ81912.1 pimeloyl-[acyl-carrier protein] methyl ester esterase [Paenibacillus marchantiophytorum]